MTPEVIKIGLERYSSVTLDPVTMGTVFVSSSGHQTLLMWHEVASAALTYVEQMELLCVAAAETLPGRLYMQAIQEKGAMARRIKELEAMNKRQSEMLKAKGEL